MESQQAEAMARVAQWEADQKCIADNLRATILGAQQVRCPECGTMMGDPYHAFQGCSIWFAMQTGMRNMTQAEIDALRSPGAYQNVGLPLETIRAYPWPRNVGIPVPVRVGLPARLWVWLKERW